MYKSLRNALIAASAAAALGLAMAQPSPDANPGASNNPPPALNVGDVYQRVTAAGYQDVRQIELDRGRYEVKGKNAKGEYVKLYVNANTGAVEHTQIRPAMPPQGERGYGREHERGHDRHSKGPGDGAGCR